MFLPLAEVAPPPALAVPAAVFLGGVLLFTLCHSFDILWRATLGPIFVKIGNVGFGSRIPHLSAHPLGFLKSFNTDVERWLKTGEALGERYMVNAFGTLLWFFYNLTFTTVKLAYDFNTAIDNVWANVTRSDGTAFNARTQARLDKLAARETAIEHRLGRLEQAKRAGGAAAGALDHAKLQRGIDRLEREIGQVRAKEARLEKTATRTHAHTASDVYGVPHWVARRLGKLEKATVGVGAVALVTAAAVKMGFRWIKCDSAKRVGRRLNCGSFRFLESLLSLAIDALVITNLCTVTKTLARVAHGFQPVLTKLTTGIVDLMKCQGSSLPPNLKLNAATLPPQTKSKIQL